MIWMKDLYTIYQKLDEIGVEDVKKEIVKAHLYGCSVNGAEAYFLVLQQLVLIKKDNVKIYEVIKREVESIIQYSRLN
ncbi:hypothetical protein [uncultured Chitinophaga sp.]|jgi:hypothetical protein|uniref:hypothetical protein n=1 Tax=uncultured Chitinophaga sp. TaxID=339340 RepID=UPI00260689D3|nr:hypothetical protein [uncultured Chitinophaga sp.]